MGDFSFCRVKDPRATHGGRGPTGSEFFYGARPSSDPAVKILPRTKPDGLAIPFPLTEVDRKSLEILAFMDPASRIQER